MNSLNLQSRPSSPKFRSLAGRRGQALQRVYADADLRDRLRGDTDTCLGPCRLASKQIAEAVLPALRWNPVCGTASELYQVQYPAPGDPNLASHVQKLLAPVPVRHDDRWGLGHGTWSVLRHLYPQADIPVVQLSIDETQPPSFHYEVGERLAQLGEEGILILGSGNVVHNLHAYAWGRHAPEPYDWAISFETRIRELLVAGEYKPLVNYEHQLGREAELAVPTPDHYLPLLYIAGTRTSSEPLTFPVEGVDGGSVSMLAVRVG